MALVPSWHVAPPTCGPDPSFAPALAPASAFAAVGAAVVVVGGGAAVAAAAVAPAEVARVIPLARRRGLHLAPSGDEPDESLGGKSPADGELSRRPTIERVSWSSTPSASGPAPAGASADGSASVSGTLVPVEIVEGGPGGKEGGSPDDSEPTLGAEGFRLFEALLDCTPF